MHLSPPSTSPARPSTPPTPTTSTLSPFARARGFGPMGMKSWVSTPRTPSKVPIKYRIKLLEDAALPDLDALTPVVHTLTLGSIAFPEGEG